MDPAGESAVPIDRVLVIRLNEAPAHSDAGSKRDQPKNSLLEWTKAVLLPLVTVVISIAGGYYFTSLSKDREERESNDHLFAQILTQREQSDSLVRKDMFETVLTNFFTDAKHGDWSDKILQLELLASNFNQSLDLAPLFKDLSRRLESDASLSAVQRKQFRKRLDSTAGDVIVKQVISLGRRGFVKGEIFPIGGWEERFSKPVFDETLERTLLVPATQKEPSSDLETMRFLIGVVDVNMERREIEIRLRVVSGASSELVVDRHFWVGQYDFPMLDNTQLPDGSRASVVLTEFFMPDDLRDRVANSWAMLRLVVFPAASASFKERQDYDEILADKLNAENTRAGSVGKEP